MARKENYYLFTHFVLKHVKLLIFYSLGTGPFPYTGRKVNIIVVIYGGELL